MGRCFGNGCKRMMHKLRIVHLRMDFIGDNQQVMFRTDFGQLLQRLFFPDDATRIVRIAYNQYFAPVVDDRLQMLEVHLVNAVDPFKRVVDHFAAHVFRHNPERMIDWRLYDYFVSRLREALQHKPDSFDDTRNVTDPLLPDVPLVFVVYPVDDAVIIRFRGERVAENLMFAPFLDGVNDKVRRAEIQVGHP